jgi:hypothetical protein
VASAGLASARCRASGVRGVDLRVLPWPGAEVRASGQAGGQPGEEHGQAGEGDRWLTARSGWGGGRTGSAARSGWARAE